MAWTYDIVPGAVDTITESWGEELPTSINSSTTSTPLQWICDLASHGSEGSLQVSQKHQSFK